jgi:micrococcal nuclease
VLLRLAIACYSAPSRLALDAHCSPKKSQFATFRGILLDGKEETLRIIAVDTEESWPGGSKPVTQAGLKASETAKKFFKTSSRDFVRVDIEFDTNDPEEICLKKHRGNYGRLICYVHKGQENYNLKLIKEGWSPCFFQIRRI